MKKALCGLFCLALAIGLGDRLPAADDAGDELVQMTIGLVSDKDRDMRAVGLQQVREGAKGPAATRRFAALLPKLTADAQAGLLDALGDRGDAAARPAAREAIKSPEEPVRCAALRALGPLGQAADVPLLAPWLATPGPEKAAARASLVRLHGQDVNAAIVAELKGAKPAVRAELPGVLAARAAAECLPSVLAAAEDADAEVRVGALAALRHLAGPGQTAAVVKLLKAAKNDQEQWGAQSALMSICTRGRETCVEPILAGMADASPSATAALLAALGRAGGAKALEAIAAATKDLRPVVQGAAVRLLANWSDTAAVPHLLAIAKQAGSLGQHALAIQGLVRLASPLRDRPANLPLLADVMKVARRPEEKRMVLGVLGGVPTPESLALILPAMDDPQLNDEACLAAVLIAEKLSDPVRRRSVLQQARDKAKDSQIRQRAEEALKSPGSPDR